MSDRPLSRSLIKLGALLAGPARAHRQDLWPHLAIDRPGGLVTWRGKPLLTLRRPSDLIPQDAPLLAVVGSGPSLAAQRIENLPPRTAILLNGAATLADRIAPLALAIEDERFVFRHHEMLPTLPRDLPWLLSPAALRAIASVDPSLLTTRPVALIDNLAKPLNASRRRLDDPALDALLLRGDGAALSRDPDVGVVIVGTVAFSALQIALAARPAQIVLVGIDLGNAAAPRFYETAGDTAPSGLVAGLDRSLAGFALARDHAAASGVALTCASPVSALLGLGMPRTDLLDA
ncbi:glycosyl transferase [Loktanella sp. M215]|uniref:glycosyl transferase n=1 Tax=Loktanella sp. M215 TaxID=2675431 RepID=UPI001F364C66|nr:glycosyl transferase [Loktanella sp. M215]MCF7699265.1 glycosyl transferase [Loktanella sp. M215]